MSDGLFASIHEALIFVLNFSVSVPQFRPKYYPTRQSVRVPVGTVHEKLKLKTLLSDCKQKLTADK